MPLWFGLIPGGCAKGSTAIWSVTLQLWLKRRNFHFAEDAAPSLSLNTRRTCAAQKVISNATHPLRLCNVKSFVFSLALSDPPPPPQPPSLLLCLLLSFFSMFSNFNRERMCVCWGPAGQCYDTRKPINFHEWCLSNWKYSLLQIHLVFYLFISTVYMSQNIQYNWYCRN